MHCHRAAGAVRAGATHATFAGRLRALLAAPALAVTAVSLASPPAAAQRAGPRVDARAAAPAAAHDVAGPAVAGRAVAASPVGYYRHPAIHGETIVFTAEGDLWRTTVDGGVARRLTTHPGGESHAAISPDGRTIAFIGHYEGPGEVYTMPIDGGIPTRRTWNGAAGRNAVVGWTPDGRVLYATRRHSGLPNMQLVALDLGPASAPAAADVAAAAGGGTAGDAASRGVVRPLAVKASAAGQTPVLLPLAQAADGAYDAAGHTLYFTRLPFQGSHARGYRGGTAQQIWKFAAGTGAAEPTAGAATRDAAGGAAKAAPARDAVPLTADYPGTSKEPMPWNGRVYFASDRSGVMNLWSMAPDGSDLRQHTRHDDYEVRSPALHDGRIVYQHGADLRLLDLRTGEDRVVPIRLASDFDHMREQWIDEPMEWLTSVHVSPDGGRVVLTARGEVFVAPVGTGRLVEATRASDVRYRDARFLPDGERLLVLSDESGEIELWTVPANGVGERRRLTEDGTVFRSHAVPSPDGRWIAHADRDKRLWLYDVEADENRRIADSEMHNWLGGTGAPFSELVWSPDSRWVAYTTLAPNQIGVIRLYDTETGATVDLTTDRYDSWSPAWSPDGEWLYFLSDREYRSVVGSPWGTRQPEPFFDRRTRVYAVALAADGARPPFAAPTEVDRAGARGEAEEAAASERVAVAIDTVGLARRLWEVPVPAGSYDALWTDGERLYYLSRDAGGGPTALKSFALEHDAEPETFLADVRGYEPTADGKKLLIRRGDDLFVVPAGAKAPGELAEHRVDLSGWRIAYDPREEWRQMYREAWRLHRDWFYDPGMHGVDWPAMYEKYLPLAERVTDRMELADVLGQLIAELSLLHASVRPGDVREGDDDVEPASLGARLVRDDAAGGWRVAHIFRTDPDLPDRLAPLARPGVDVREGDVITLIDGVPTLSVADPGALLRNKAGKQVLLRVKAGSAREAGRRATRARRAARGGGAWDVVVVPVSMAEEAELRYAEWEYTRRLAVDSLSGGRIGYVHLRAMGSRDMAEFARQYYPVFNREALIVDVRHNRGGNIDSWILSRLTRRAWMYWQPRVGKPFWNMNYAFRGPMVALVNEFTASDGEAFAEGFRRLGLGPVIGTRTWGGEVWLSSSNVLVDRGIATAAEVGVYGPEGEWLIEGWGVEPDIVVDNLPHGTFLGGDAQLEAAVRHLLDALEERPVDVPAAPPYPRKGAGTGQRSESGQ
ncbi:MAG TPA: S41 family peptidase [Longimicrobiales bacterium]